LQGKAGIENSTVSEEATASSKPDLHEFVLFKYIPFDNSSSKQPEYDSITSHERRNRRKKGWQRKRHAVVGISPSGRIAAESFGFPNKSVSKRRIEGVDGLESIRRVVQHVERLPDARARVELRLEHGWAMSDACRSGIGPTRTPTTVMKAMLEKMSTSGKHDVLTYAAAWP